METHLYSGYSGAVVVVDCFALCHTFGECALANLSYCRMNIFSLTRMLTKNIQFGYYSCIYYTRVTALRRLRCARIVMQIISNINTPLQTEC